MNHHQHFDPRLAYVDYLRMEHLKRGQIYVVYEIEEREVEELLLELSEAKHMGLKRLDLRINSPGGDAYGAMAVYDTLVAMRKEGVSIDATVEGLAASAAAMVLLQAAEHRYARPHARFLLHEVRRWVTFQDERTSDLQDVGREMNALEAMIVGILAERCRKTEEEVKRVIERREAWMSAQEALDFGLIDRIL